MASSKCGFTYFCCAFLCCSEASSVSCVVQERAGVKWKEATKICLPPLSEKTVLIQKETENKIVFFLVHETLKTRFFSYRNRFSFDDEFCHPTPHSLTPLVDPQDRSSREVQFKFHHFAKAVWSNRVRLPEPRGPQPEEAVSFRSPCVPEVGLHSQIQLPEVRS